MSAFGVLRTSGEANTKQIGSERPKTALKGFAVIREDSSSIAEVSQQV